MKVTQVAVCPSEASRKAGRPALTPELLAACGARYSRNNEGLASILAKIDPGNLEKSVDSIFRMMDYGHQSIADMVPVAMFMDGISIWLAYYVWSLCNTAGGQESSTRYLKISLDGLIPPEELGLAKDQVPEWSRCMQEAFRAYQSSLSLWEELSRENPSFTNIPRSLINDPSEAAQKKVARMRRNFAFDRARYFLPVASATNVMLLMSARGWVTLCQHLLSHPSPEPRRLGEMVRAELEISAPRMLKHAGGTESNERLLAREFEKLVKMACVAPASLMSPTDGCSNSARPYLSLLLPDGLTQEEVAQDLGFHANRYAPVGSSLQRIGVRFGWSAIAFAEIRDLNRHRTGTKYCPQVPSGFYFALDQIPSGSADYDRHKKALLENAKVGTAVSEQAAQALRKADPAYIYWSLLGTEFPFEHITTADKFIYEAELRTGLGAHFRYAKHLRDALALWYDRFPGTRKLILEGSAEPE
jgi:thymidylate synthase ThyX